MVTILNSDESKKFILDESELNIYIFQTHTLTHTYTYIYI